LKKLYDFSKVYGLFQKTYQSRILLQKNFPAADTSILAVTGAYKTLLLPKKPEFTDLQGVSLSISQHPTHEKYY
jgi:hypothetical protein